MSLDLTDQERQLLLQLLLEELEDLPPEIRHTDDRNYRTELRSRREMLRHLVEQLEAEPATKA